MTRLLEKAFEEASKLPELEQNPLARWLIRVRIPGLDEQSLIREVLSSAEEEIEILETKLSALEKQKRGLMQKLLTGEVRVKL